MASQQTLTTGASAADQQSYSTASVSPTADALVLLALVTRTPGTGAGVQLPSSVSGAGLTFELVDAIAYDNGDHCLSLWRAMSSSPSSGAISISSFPGVQQRAIWHVWEVSDLPADALGDNGVHAIAQAVEHAADAVTSLSVPYGAVANAGNWAYAAFGTGQTLVTTTPGDGWTELADLSAGELSAALHTQYRESSAAAAEMTASAACDFGGIAVEIVTAEAAAGFQAAWARGSNVILGAGG